MRTSSRIYLIPHFASQGTMVRGIKFQLVRGARKPRIVCGSPLIVQAGGCLTTHRKWNFLRQARRYPATREAAEEHALSSTKQCRTHGFSGAGRQTISLLNRPARKLSGSASIRSALLAPSRTATPRSQRPTRIETWAPCTPSSPAWPRLARDSLFPSCPCSFLAPCSF